MRGATLILPFSLMALSDLASDENSIPTRDANRKHAQKAKPSAVILPFAFDALY